MIFPIVILIKISIHSDASAVRPNAELWRLRKLVMYEVNLGSLFERFEEESLDEASKVDIDEQVI